MKNIQNLETGRIIRVLDHLAEIQVSTKKWRYVSKRTFKTYLFKQSLGRKRVPN
jgi:hypothetical protein